MDALEQWLDILYDGDEIEMENTITLTRSKLVELFDHYKTLVVGIDRTTPVETMSPAASATRGGAMSLLKVRRMSYNNSSVRGLETELTRYLNQPIVEYDEEDESFDQLVRRPLCARKGVKRRDPEATGFSISAKRASAQISNKEDRMDQQGHGQPQGAGAAQFHYGQYDPNHVNGTPSRGPAVASVGDSQSPSQLAQHQLAYQHIYQQQQQQLQQQLQSFWANQYQEIEKVTDFKNHSLPLARIKKIMKADEGLPREDLKDEALASIPRAVGGPADAYPYYYMPAQHSPQAGTPGMIIGKPVVDPALFLVTEAYILSGEVKEEENFCSQSAPKMRADKKEDCGISYHPSTQLVFLFPSLGLISVTTIVKYN
ncbi:hypothetical protein Vadar_003485 [Vaccinium darrowii]|uniref:Uncharacterized protein n=1 Tax=Vaccinium darrowii TaxID=229202 RepID=A0ACB7ZHX0_9ERIC|nr:hypothetical protein Vadar_003485 [Vaccinium darrowii]